VSGGLAYFAPVATWLDVPRLVEFTTTTAHVRLHPLLHAHWDRFEIADTHLAHSPSLPERQMERALVVAVALAAHAGVVPPAPDQVRSRLLAICIGSRANTLHGWVAPLAWPQVVDVGALLKARSLNASAGPLELLVCATDAAFVHSSASSELSHAFPTTLATWTKVGDVGRGCAVADELTRSFFHNLTHTTLQDRTLHIVTLAAQVAASSKEDTDAAGALRTLVAGLAAPAWDPILRCLLAWRRWLRQPLDTGSCSTLAAACDACQLD